MRNLGETCDVRGEVPEENPRHKADSDREATKLHVSLSATRNPRWSLLRSRRYPVQTVPEESIEMALDRTQAKAVLSDIARFFPATVHWSQNDAWYLDLRDRLARAIVALK